MEDFVYQLDDDNSQKNPDDDEKCVIECDTDRESSDNLEDYDDKKADPDYRGFEQRNTMYERKSTSLSLIKGRQLRRKHRRVKRDENFNAALQDKEIPSVDSEGALPLPDVADLHTANILDEGASASSRRLHNRRYRYTYGKRRRCHICGSMTSDYKEHIRSVHNNCSRRVLGPRTCPFCGRCFKRYTLAKHIRRMHRKENSVTQVLNDRYVEPRVVIATEFCSPDDDFKTFKTYVLSQFDPLRKMNCLKLRANLCKTDKTMELIGWKLFLSAKMTARHFSPMHVSATKVKRQMLHLAKFFLNYKTVLEMRNDEGAIRGAPSNSCQVEPTILDMFHAKNFPVIMETFRLHTTCVDHDGNAYRRWTVEPRMYSLLMNVAAILRIHFLAGKNFVRAADIAEFQKLLNSKRQTMGVCRQNKHTAGKQARRTERKKDVIALQRHTVNRIQSMLKDPSAHLTSSEFSELRDLCCSHLTLLNSRRGGIPAELQLSAWTQACNSTEPNESRMNGLSDVEKEAYHDSVIVSQIAKDKVIPIVVPADTVDAVKKLADSNIRCISDVHPENPYLFPKTSQSDGHVSGFQAINATCEKAGVRWISATTMLHYTISVYTSLDLPENSRADEIEHSEAFNILNYKHLRSPPPLRSTKQCGEYIVQVTLFR